MKKLPLYSGTPALLAATLLGVAASGAAAMIPSPERLLPDDTLAMVTVPDFSKVREIWKISPQTRLWKDPAMKPFKDALLAKWNGEFIEPLERDLGVRFDDYSSLPQGQLTLAVTQNGWQGSGDPSPAMVLLLDTKDKSSQLKRNLADLRKKWVDAGKSIRTEKIRGVEFSVVALSSNDVPKTLQKWFSQSNNNDPADAGAKPPPRSELAVGQFESLLIAGSSTRAVEKVMAHLTGGAMPALGDLAAYEANRLALFRDAPVYGWVNVKTFIDLLARKPAEKDAGDTPDPFDVMGPERILRAIGLSGVRTMAFSVQSSNEGSGFQMFVGVPEADRRGIFKVFSGQGKESSPPPFVPADVEKFQRCRLDGQKIWATLQAMMNDINPQLLSGLNFLLDTANAAAKQKDPNFDINRDLFGNLGDDMITYQKAAGGAAGSNSASSLFLISSPQPEHLAAALKNIGVLWNAPGTAPADREFLGRKIFSMPLPAMPLPTGNPSGSAPQTLSYATSGGYVALTTDASLLEEYLRSGDSQQKELREMPGLIDAAARVGGMGTGWFGYENQAQTGRAVLESLRNSTNNPATRSVVSRSPFLGFLFHFVDFSLLPPFDQISKYFYFDVYAVSVSPDGLTFKMYTPVPPEMRK
jgi:hypothetical protein